MHSYHQEVWFPSGYIHVLILVLMEDALVHVVVENYSIVKSVLILVLMEDALVRPP